MDNYRNRQWPGEGLGRNKRPPPCVALVMDSQERFEQLKRKYAPVVRFLDQSEARIQAMDVQNDKLMIRAAVQSPEMRDRVLDEIARVDDSFGDMIPDIRVEGRPNFPMTGQTTVNAGESFSHQGDQPKGTGGKAR